MTHQTTQSTRDEGVKNLVKLLEFAQTAWSRFANSKRRTMPDLRVPGDIQFFFLGGKKYILGRKREILFRRTEIGRGYDPNIFHLYEVVDEKGRVFRLEFDLARGGIFDGDSVGMTCLDSPRMSGVFGGNGPRVRE